jgi:hypothetical protein
MDSDEEKHYAEINFFKAEELRDSSSNYTNQSEITIEI